MIDWAWFGLLLAAVAVEAYLIAAGRQTLSQRARAAGRRWPWLPWLAVAGVVVLFGHFWLGWFW